MLSLPVNWSLECQESNCSNPNLTNWRLTKKNPKKKNPTNSNEFTSASPKGWKSRPIALFLLNLFPLRFDAHVFWLLSSLSASGRVCYITTLPPGRRGSEERRPWGRRALTCRCSLCGRTACFWPPHQLSIQHTPNPYIPDGDTWFKQHPPLSRLNPCGWCHHFWRCKLLVQLQWSFWLFINQFPCWLPSVALIKNTNL